MIRKVFSNGPSLVVTLPCEWVKTHGIQEGQELNVSADGCTLSFQASSVERKETAEIDTKGIDRTFLRCWIRSAYRKGYDQINVRQYTKKIKHHRLNKEVYVVDAAREEAASLIGFEVLETSDKQTRIRGFSKEEDQDFDVFLRKTFLNLIEYAQDLMNVQNNQFNSSVWEEKHWNIKKFINYSIRILNKKGCKNQKDLPLLYHLVSSLDFVLGIIQNTGRFVHRHNIICNEQTKNIHEEIISLFRLYYQIYYTYSNERVIEFSKRQFHVWDNITKLAQHISPEETIILNRLADIMDILYRLIETKMELEFK